MFLPNKARNNVFYFLFFEILRDLQPDPGRITTLMHLSAIKAQKKQRNNDRQAFWDIPLHAEHTGVSANTATEWMEIIDHKARGVGSGGRPPFFWWWKNDEDMAPPPTFTVAPTPLHKVKKVTTFEMRCS